MATLALRTARQNTQHQLHGQILAADARSKRIAVLYMISIRSFLRGRRGSCLFRMGC
jgi:hypothetical protein